MFKRAMLLLLSLSLLSGCGFHLKGAGTQTALNLTQLSVQFAPNVLPQLRQELVEQLRQNGVSIVEVSALAQEFAEPTLVIENSQMQVRRTATSYLGDTTAESMQWRQLYRMQGAQSTLFSAEASVVRDRQLQPEAMLAAEQEREGIVQNMAVQVAQQIMRRLAIYAEQKTAKDSVQP